LALALALVAAVLMCWILSIEEAFRLAPLTGLAVFLCGFQAFALLVHEQRMC
jgi:hypothetical protein